MEQYVEGSVIEETNSNCSEPPIVIDDEGTILDGADIRFGIKFC